MRSWCLLQGLWFCPQLLILLQSRKKATGKDRANHNMSNMFGCLLYLDINDMSHFSQGESISGLSVLIYSVSFSFVKAYFVCMCVQVHMQAHVIEFVHMPVEATGGHCLSLLLSTLVSNIGSLADPPGSLIQLDWAVSRSQGSPCSASAALEI